MTKGTANLKYVLEQQTKQFLLGRTKNKNQIFNCAINKINFIPRVPEQVKIMIKHQCSQSFFLHQIPKIDSSQSFSSSVLISTSFFFFCLFCLCFSSSLSIYWSFLSFLCFIFSLLTSSSSLSLSSGF